MDATRLTNEACPTPGMLPRSPLQVKGATTAELIEAAVSYGMPEAVGRRLQTIVVKHGADFLPETIEQVSRRKWRALCEGVTVPSLELAHVATSPLDGFAKYLFRSPRGGEFESVGIPLVHRPGKERFVVCVSTQVGCGVGCVFCATGKLGFKRQLAAWEIVDQVLQVRKRSPHPVRGVVFMGMGEPLLNYKEVLRAAEILSDPSGAAIDGKSITISTAGVVPMMRRFTQEKRKFRLITSLHAATDELRRQLVPMNDLYPLRSIMDALREYQVSSRRRVLLAWTMMAGVNMSREQMRALREITDGLRFVLDLIPVNDATGCYRPPNHDELQSFLDIVRDEVSCPIALRYSGGKDVHGACGMLAGIVGDESN